MEIKLYEGISELTFGEAEGREEFIDVTVDDEDGVSYITLHIDELFSAIIALQQKLDRRKRVTCKKNK